jgi:hypothetical protein
MRNSRLQPYQTTATVHSPGPRVHRNTDAVAIMTVCTTQQVFDQRGTCKPSKGFTSEVLPPIQRLAGPEYHPVFTTMEPRPGNATGRRTQADPQRHTARMHNSRLQPHLTDTTTTTSQNSPGPESHRNTDAVAIKTVCNTQQVLIKGEPVNPQKASPLRYYPPFSALLGRSTIQCSRPWSHHQAMPSAGACSAGSLHCCWC